MSDKLRQRLQPGDRIRVNGKAKNKSIHGREGEVVRSDMVEVLVDGKSRFVTPTSLDVLED